MAKSYDLLIIGAGPGGYTAAIRAAKEGLKTGVIEKEKLGGTCLNRGCISTKALLHASSMFSMMQKCDEFGVSADSIAFDFKKMQQYKKNAVRDYRNEIHGTFEKLGIDLIYGTATIRRGKTVEVKSDKGKDFYQAKHIIIATGAVPRPLSIPGADLDGVWYSDRILKEDKWKFDRLTIIGGGVIGVEMATIFNALCAKVYLVERAPHLLGPMDQEVSEALKEELTRRGIRVYCGANIHKITKEEGLICHISKDGEEILLRSGCVLVAVGRQPYTDGLFGEDVNFQMKDGKLEVDSEFMTSEPEVYAVGDVTADIQLAHVAAAQATYVVEKIAKKVHTIRLSVVPNVMYAKLPVVPNCIYTEPEIATVGLTEEAALACGMKVRCGKYSMGENGRSIISREEGGFIRLIFEAYSNNLVGAQIVCPRATDMISEMATAVAAGLNAGQLMMAMRAHPTYSEGIAGAIEDAMRS